MSDIWSAVMLGFIAGAPMRFVLPLAIDHHLYRVRRFIERWDATPPVVQVDGTGAATDLQLPAVPADVSPDYAVLCSGIVLFKAIDGDGSSK
jgi:hypothetical protein